MYTIIHRYITQKYNGIRGAGILAYYEKIKNMNLTRVRYGKLMIDKFKAHLN